MYILYNGEKYACKCKPSETMRYGGLPEDFPVPVSGKIVLCADDGFVLRTDVVEDYLRQSFANRILTLTNEEAVEPPVEEPTVWDELDAAYVEGVNSV